ncbi:MAG: PilZ domain-containing protein [Candidatus Omnitrophica bacterium]|nr:PilZ domain-containing protein [Candidatus Omnitrophota bacterium]
MSKPSSGDRRAFVRAKRVLSINYRIQKSRKKNIDSSWGLSTTHDMSFNGVSFYSDCDFIKGDILEIHVLMSGVLDIFKGYGRVVRVEKKKSGAFYFIAVKFIDKKDLNRAKKSSTTKKKTSPKTSKPAKKKTTKKTTAKKTISSTKKKNK